MFYCMLFPSALSKFELRDYSGEDGEYDDDTSLPPSSACFLPWCVGDVVRGAERRLIKAVALGASSAADMAHTGRRKHT